MSQETLTPEQILSHERETAYLQRHAYTYFRRAKDIGWCAHLLKRQSCAALPAKSCAFPEVINDHIRVYKNRKGFPVITCQPYVAPKDYARVAGIVAEFAARWGLYFRMSNEESWWNPGQTILIELWGKEPADSLRQVLATAEVGR